MADVATGIFHGSPFVRWSLGTVAFLTAVVFGLSMTDMRGIALCAGIAFEAALVLLFLAMLMPTRCHAAARGVCAIVFLAYIAYVIDMGITAPGSFWPPPAHRSASTGYNAVCGTLVIGVPALVFALRSRRAVQTTEELAVDADDEILTEEDEVD